MNQQLQDHISQSRQAGKTDEQIRKELLSLGWQEELINQYLDTSSDNKKSGSLNSSMEKELMEHKILDQKHMALDQEHIDLDKEHIAIDKRHKKWDRILVVTSIVTVSLVGAILVYLSGYQLRVAEYQLQVEDARQKLSEQEGRLSQQGQELTQQQEDVDTLKKIAVDISVVVEEWSPRMAQIGCEWDYVPQVQAYAELWGSGMLAQITNDSGVTYYDLITNKHVIEDQGYSPSRCVVGFHPDFVFFMIENDDSNFLWGNDEDWGLIALPKNTDVVSRTENKLQVCSHPAAIGEKILILGYPEIGSRESVTVTEGIISGFEGSYYVTDAKIEHGSSGGAAILLKNNCYLGIPTWGKEGTAESFARILSSGIVLPSTQ